MNCVRCSPRAAAVRILRSLLAAAVFVVDKPRSIATVVEEQSDERERLTSYDEAQRSVVTFLASFGSAPWLKNQMHYHLIVQE